MFEAAWVSGAFSALGAVRTRPIAEHPDAGRRAHHDRDALASRPNRETARLAPQRRIDRVDGGHAPPDAPSPLVDYESPPARRARPVQGSSRARSIRRLTRPAWRRPNPGAQRRRPDRKRPWGFQDWLSAAVAPAFVRGGAVPGHRLDGRGACASCQRGLASGRRLTGSAG